MGQQKSTLKKAIALIDHSVKQFEQHSILTPQSFIFGYRKLIQVHYSLLLLIIIMIYIVWSTKYSLTLPPAGCELS